MSDLKNVDALKLGRFVFERQAQEYGADEYLTNEIWESDAELRSFWANEAKAILEFLGFVGEKS